MFGRTVSRRRGCGNAIHPATYVRHFCEGLLLSHRFGASGYPRRYRIRRTDTAPELRQLLRAHSKHWMESCWWWSCGQIDASFQLSSRRHRTAYWPTPRIESARCARSLAVCLCPSCHFCIMQTNRGVLVSHRFLALTVSLHSSSQSSYRAQSA